MAEPDKVAASTEIDRLADAVEIGEQELAQRKQLLELDEEDVRRLAAINDIAGRYADACVQDRLRIGAIHPRAAPSSVGHSRRATSSSLRPWRPSR